MVKCEAFLCVNNDNGACTGSPNIEMEKKGITREFQAVCTDFLEQSEEVVISGSYKANDTLIFKLESGGKIMMNVESAKEIALTLADKLGLDVNKIQEIYDCESKEVLVGGK